MYFPVVLHVFSSCAPCIFRISAGDKLLLGELTYINYFPFFPFFDALASFFAGFSALAFACGFPPAAPAFELSAVVEHFAI